MIWLLYALDDDVLPCDDESETAYYNQDMVLFFLDFCEILYVLLNPVDVWSFSDTDHIDSPQCHVSVSHDPKNEKR